jgi:hypothetical protein
LNTGFQAGFAAALLDAKRVPPPGLRSWNGSDVARRFGVYRNNVLVSLMEALGATFPVVKQLVGDEFFTSMAAAYVRAYPPSSPVLARYGARFSGWLASLKPIENLPYLPGMARLEFARVQAWHAADAEPLPAEVIARRCDSPALLPASYLRLHPSLQVIRASHDVHSLWAAHQCEGDWPDFDLDRPCAALVLRTPADEVMVVRVDDPSATFFDALRRGFRLGDAALAAPQADLGAAIALLLRHGAIVAWPDPEATA